MPCCYSCGEATRSNGTLCGQNTRTKGHVANAANAKTKAPLRSDNGNATTRPAFAGNASRGTALRASRINAVYASAGSQKQDFHSSIAHDSAVSTAFASRVSNANRVPAATCRKLQQNTHCQRGKRAMPSAESAGHVPRRLAAVGNAQYVSKSCRRTGLRPSNKGDRPGKMERKRATSAYKPQSLHLLQSEQPCD